MNGAVFQASDGVQTVDLSGRGPGGVAQTFTTRPGVVYQVFYSLAGNPGGGPTVKTGKLLINGALAQTFTADITGHSFANMGYVTKAVRFIATGLTTTVEFDSTTESAYGPVIDDVSVEPCGCRPIACGEFAAPQAASGAS